MIKDSSFQPAWWMSNCHVQTIWPVLLRKRPKILVDRERLCLPDDDFIDLDWTKSETDRIVIVLHGLEGSIHSHYAAGILSALHEQGYCAVLMHFRGCSGEHNKQASSYHSGETGDLGFVIQTINERYPQAALAAVGYSLGGNVLLKYLGETQSTSALKAAVAVSVPFDLASGARRLNQGLSKFYQRHLLHKLQSKIIDKFSHRDDAPFALNEVTHWNDFHTFDNFVTAPLHGFKSSDDYYEQSSSRQYLARIKTPTLILHSFDDPFLPPEAIPKENELSKHVTLELSSKGGHVGFTSGRFPWCPRYWLEERIPEFLDQQLS